MTDQGIILYKLIVLYMLDRVDFPLTNSQISQFILDKGYTDYFTIQNSINELAESEFITTTVVRNTTQFELTKEGHEAMELFDSKLPDAIKIDILHYFEENKISLRNEVYVYADYEVSTSIGYNVSCTIKDKQETLLEIKINVPSKDQAIAICDSWSDRSNSIYDLIIANLWNPQ